MQRTDVPPSEWGASAASSFITKTHHEPSPAIDPTKVKLATPFIVCIVGASRGIGAGVACKTAAKCRTYNSEIDIEIVKCDITSYASVAALAGTTNERFGRLDVVVVNSGYSGPVALSLTSTDPETFQQAIDVNYVGTFHCAKRLIPLLLSTTNGAKSFVAVSSLATLIIRGPIANAQYCVSKMAQLKLLEHVHEQYSSQGLKSFSVHPGAVASEMALETAPESFKEALVDSPELCGAFCVWLTKDDGKTWLSGRLCSANWDVEELEKRREEVVKRDLLKARLEV